MVREGRGITFMNCVNKTLSLSLTILVNVTCFHSSTVLGTNKPANVVKLTAAYDNIGPPFEWVLERRKTESRTHNQFSTDCVNLDQ